MTHTIEAAQTRPSSTTRGWWLAWLFGATSFMGAALLFMVQPLAARLVLPYFGGSATVWSTSSLLFQVLLLVGYVYAHISTRRLGARWQPRGHVLVLLLPLAALPLALPSDAAPDGQSPAFWLLRVLFVMVGVPFLVLSATGPLVQRWYSWSDGPRANDPYFLFAASNLGSFVGLLSYPFLIERALTLTQQRWWWSVACGIFLALMAACALAVRGGRAATVEVSSQLTRPSGRNLALWTFWAFIPSSLMLAATVQLSTDIAAIPLLWVLPLAAYLLSFVAAFARTSRTLPAWIIRLVIVLTVTTGVLTTIGLARWTMVLVATNVLAVAATGFVAHARLADSRPAPEHLTAFYLVISVGGALGGLLNGIVAPLLFTGVWEYLLTIALVPLLGVGVAAGTWTPRRGHVLSVAGTIGIALAVLVSWRLGVPVSTPTVVVVGLATVLLIIAWLAVRAPGLLVVAVLVATVATDIVQQRSTLLRDRNFYGSYRITASDGMHELAHGTTLHGTQFTDPAKRGIPTTYYSRSGPLGTIISHAQPGHTAVIGLGTGAIATYGHPGQRLTFFELDPAVADIARNERYFTYLADSQAEVEVITGDGRLAISEMEDHSIDLLVLDAFSSDAIPVHLLTREAFDEYAEKLAPGGTIAVHISNRTFNLGPVVQAAAADLGMPALAGDGQPRETGATQSVWIAITDSDDMEAHLTGLGWLSLAALEPVEWTDDYSSVLSVLL